MHTVFATTASTNALHSAARATMSFISTRRYTRSIFFPFAVRCLPSKCKSRGSASSTGTPSLSNRAFKISNSLHVGTCHPLAELRHRLGHIPHSLFIFRRKKKRPQKRTVYAVTKSQFRLTQPLVEIFREFRRATQLRLQQLVPLFGCRAGSRTPRRSRRCTHTHFVFAPPLPEPATELLADPLAELV